MDGVIVRIITRHDAANDLAVSSSQKKRGVAVLIEWMVLAIEKPFALENEWRHPGRIILVSAPGEFDEVVSVPAIPDWRNFNCGHKERLLRARGPLDQLDH
jgi:hypothetical protein